MVIKETEIITNRKRRYKGDIVVNHENTTCYLCNSKETYIHPNGRSVWCKYKTDNNRNFTMKGTNWDGKSYICQKCYDEQKYQENGKLKAKSRNKELSKNSTSGKGFIGEQIWCKVRGVKNCNIELDNFHTPKDHSPDPEYGIVNTKTSKYNEKYRYWSGFDIENDECDNFVLFCMNKEWTNIERTYIIPKKVVGNRTRITISKNTVNSWYSKYQIDEKPYNEAYHSMNLKDCPVLKID